MLPSLLAGFHKPELGTANLELRRLLSNVLHPEQSQRQKPSAFHSLTRLPELWYVKTWT